MDHNERIYIRTLLLFILLTNINKLYFYLTYIFLIENNNNLYIFNKL